jgi:two-component system, OmpR family, response regulator
MIIMSEKLKLLLVDDDYDVIDQIIIMLKDEEYEIFTAHGEKEAEELLTKIQPDIVITDLMMEEMDSGFVLANYLRQLYPDTPIILLTAVESATGISFDSSSEEAKSWLKVDQVMKKPLRAEELKNEIHRLLAPSGKK